MGSTWWLVATRSDDAHGPHHSRLRHDHAQKSSDGFWLGGGCLHLGIVSRDASAGCTYRFSARCAAASDRIDAFFALVAKFLSAEAVAVAGSKMAMYASMSGGGGGSLCGARHRVFAFSSCFF
jgi:hypothetical protein